MYYTGHGPGTHVHWETKMTPPVEDPPTTPVKHDTFEERDKSQFSLRWLLLLITLCAAVFSCSGLLVRLASERTVHPRELAELMGMVGAMEQYRLLYDEYPPSRPQDFAAHLKAVFPRMDPAEPIPNVDAAEALVFWLEGYSQDPRHPLTGAGRVPLFDFDRSRLIDGDDDGWLEYYPRLHTDASAPFVYFAKPYEGQAYVHPTAKGVARPKVDLSKGFQIICAGPDGDYGDAGERRQRATRDNITTYVDDSADD